MPPNPSPLARLHAEFTGRLARPGATSADTELDQLRAYIKYSRSEPERRPAPGRGMTSLPTPPRPPPLPRPPIPPSAAMSRAELETLVGEAAARHGVRPDILLALARVESGFNPTARSPVGALGVMQVMPKTARGMLPPGSPEPNLFDPKLNIDLGAQYLRQMLDRFNNNYSLALAAYNAGPEAVNKYGGIPPYPAVHAYLKAVFESPIPPGLPAQDGMPVPPMSPERPPERPPEPPLVAQALPPEEFAEGGLVEYDRAVVARLAQELVKGFEEGGEVVGPEVVGPEVVGIEPPPTSEGATAPSPEMVAAKEILMPRRFQRRTLDDMAGKYGLANVGDYLSPIFRGGAAIPGTVKDYITDVATGPKPLDRLGGDIGTFGRNFWEGVKSDPVGAVLDFTPIVGEVRSAMDAKKFRDEAAAAALSGDKEKASTYGQLAALATAGAVPFFGMGLRGAGRGVKAGVEGAERQLSPLGFYSHGAETAANLAQAKGTPDQMAAMLRKYGVKPDEFYNTGIADETATNVMRSKIERDYAPKLAAAKLEMDALGLNENTINKKSPDYNRALEIRDSPETKTKYQYDRTLSAMRSEMDSAMVLRPEWASRPSVTRDELAQHFNERRPQVEETVLGFNQNEVKAARERAESAGNNWDELGPATQGRYIRSVSDRSLTNYGNDPKFRQYTLPGGENYREVLLKLPERIDEADAVYAQMRSMSNGVPNATISPEYKALQKQYYDLSRPLFRSTHWDDPDVLAHLRMSDRTGPNGEKILHLEELQSDWGKKGRKEGFADHKALAQWEIDNAAFDKMLRNAQRQHANLVALIRLTGEPLEPFKRGVESPMAFERRKAEHFNKSDALLSADPDYRASRQRLDAAKDAIRALGPKPSADSVPTAPYVTNTAAWTDLALKRALKEAAEGGYDKIVWTPGAEQVKRYSLVDKKREGMMNYYDNIVPNQLSKLVRKLDRDVKVGPTDVMLPQGGSGMIGHNNPPFEAPGLTITPKMREAIMKGQTDFAEGGLVEHDPAVVDRLAQGLIAGYQEGGEVEVSADTYDPAAVSALADRLVKGFGERHAALPSPTIIMERRPEQKPAISIGGGPTYKTTADLADQYALVDTFAYRPPGVPPKAVYGAPSLQPDAPTLGELVRKYLQEVTPVINEDGESGRAGVRSSGVFSVPFPDGAVNLMHTTTPRSGLQPRDDPSPDPGSRNPIRITNVDSTVDLGPFGVNLGGMMITPEGDKLRRVVTGDVRLPVGDASVSVGGMRVLGSGRGFGRLNAEIPLWGGKFSVSAGSTPGDRKVNPLAMIRYGRDF